MGKCIICNIEAKRFLNNDCERMKPSDKINRGFDERASERLSSSLMAFTGHNNGSARAGSLQKRACSSA